MIELFSNLNAVVTSPSYTGLIIINEDDSLLFMLLSLFLRHRRLFFFIVPWIKSMFCAGGEIGYDRWVPRIFVFIQWTVVRDGYEWNAWITVWIWKCLTLLEFYARRKLNAWQSNVSYTKTFSETFFAVLLTVEGDSGNFISLPQH